MEKIIEGWPEKVEHQNVVVTICAKPMYERYTDTTSK
jgi:hypothetical protein